MKVMDYGAFRELHERLQEPIRNTANSRSQRQADEWRLRDLQTNSPELYGFYMQKLKQEQRETQETEDNIMNYAEFHRIMEQEDATDRIIKLSAYFRENPHGYERHMEKYNEALTAERKERERLFDSSERWSDYCESRRVK